MIRIDRKAWLLVGLVLVMLSAPSAMAATIEYHYESWSVGGHTTSGVFDSEDEYDCPNGVPPGGRAWINPYSPQLLSASAGTATTDNGKIDTFSEALVGEFGAGTGWSFTASPTELTGVFDVHTYDAVGTPAAVGADFHVEYRPGANMGNLHWIQVVFTNHPLRGGTTGHGTDATYVDIFSGQTNPFYDFAGASAFDAAGDFHFYDAPRRPDVCNAHYWYADLFLVNGPAFTGDPQTVTPGAVTILGGVRWGWQNTAECIVPEPATLALLGIALAALAVRARNRSTGHC